MALPVSTTSKYNSSNAASVVVDQPAGYWSPGNLLVAILYVNRSTPTWTPPAGWNTSTGSQGGASDGGAALFWYVIPEGGAASSYTFDCSASNKTNCVVLEYDGADYSDIDAWAGGGSNHSPQTFPSVTTTVANDALVLVYGVNGTAAVTWPSGFTQEIYSANGSTNSLTVADQATSLAAGPTGTFSAAVSDADANSLCLTVALKAAAAPSNTGSGVGVVGAARSSGSGSAKSTGSGAGVAGATQASGSGTVHAAGSGTGAVGKPQASGSGAATPTNTGSGIGIVGAARSAGSGTTGGTGSGIGALGRIAGSGSGASHSPGSGVGVLGRPASAGSGASRVAGSGAGLITPRAAGVGSERSTGTGAGLVEHAAASGSGAARNPGAGTGVVQPQSAGAGVARAAGNGTGIIRPMAAGAGTQRAAGSGAGTIGAAIGSGSGGVAAPSWSLIASTSRQGAGTTPAINTTGATLIVVAVAVPTGDFNLADLSDSEGNTWEIAQQSGAVGNYTTACARLSPTTSATHTFTYSGPNAPGIGVAAFGGVSSPALDQTNNGETTGTSIPAGSITPAQNNELIITSLGFGAVETLTLPTGFATAGEAAYESGVSHGSALAYQVQTTATAVNPTWGLSASSQAGATVLSFGVLPETAARASALSESRPRAAPARPAAPAPAMARAGRSALAAAARRAQPARARARSALRALPGPRRLAHRAPAPPRSEGPPPRAQARRETSAAAPAPSAHPVVPAAARPAQSAPVPGLCASSRPDRAHRGTLAPAPASSAPSRRMAQEPPRNSSSILADGCAGCRHRPHSPGPRFAPLFKAASRRRPSLPALPWRPSCTAYPSTQPSGHSNAAIRLPSHAAIPGRDSGAHGGLRQLLPRHHGCPSGFPDAGGDMRSRSEQPDHGSITARSRHRLGVARPEPRHREGEPGDPSTCRQPGARVRLPRDLHGIRQRREHAGDLAEDRGRVRA